MVGPPGSPVRVLTGASKSGEYEPGLLVPPSSFVHRRNMVKDTGCWQDHRTLHTPIDLAFLSSAWAAGKRFTAVREVTAFKFPAPWRKDVYKHRPCFEQQDYLRRMREEPDFLGRELTAVALAYAEGNLFSPVRYADPPPDAPPGWQLDQWRVGKGLPPLGGERAPAPLYAEPDALRSRNQRGDIVPRESLDALYSGNNLPNNGIFLGRGWYGAERDDGGPFRWLHTEGELVMTKLDAQPKSLEIDCEAGPGMKCEPFELKLLDEKGVQVGVAVVSYRHTITFAISPAKVAGTSFRLVSPPGGASIPPDDRILNLRVFRINWVS
jgi:hypothetical protein